jgi:DNA topoisomerase-2
LKYELDINKSKLNFINDVINDKIVIYRNKKDNIVNELIKLKYKMIIDKNINDNYTVENKKTGFNYLINMPLYNLTEEKMNELQNTINDLEYKYNKLNESTIESIWLNELNRLKKEYLKLK